MSDWNVQITAPNGATGQLTVDGTADDATIIQQFADFVATARANDVEPIEALQGQPAQTQPVRPA